MALIAGRERALRAPATAAAAIAAVAAAGWLLVPADLDRGDALSDVARATFGVPWALVALTVGLPLLAAAHYLLAAVAVRAASGRALPLRETVYAQLAAAAANRVVPNGIGGAGVNLRFLGRCGAPLPNAVCALSALSLAGGLTGALYAGAVTSLGPVVGVNGGGQQFATLAQHGIRAGHHLPWAGIALGAVLLVVIVRRGVGPALATAARSARQGAGQLKQLLGQPRRCGALSAATMACTAVLSLAFVCSVEAVGQGGALPSVGALLAIYIVATAVGGATPVPAVFGVTEAALIAGLATAGLPFHSALVATLVFRLVTFWAPLPVGLVAMRRLRAARLL